LDKDEYVRVPFDSFCLLRSAPFGLLAPKVFEHRPFVDGVELQVHFERGRLQNESSGLTRTRILRIALRSIYGRAVDLTITKAAQQEPMYGNSTSGAVGR
jgi:hypothetical protein